MNDYVRCSNCNAEVEADKVVCPACGEILPFVDECKSCEIDFSADEQRQMFGGD